MWPQRAMRGAVGGLRQMGQTGSASRAAPAPNACWLAAASGSGGDDTNATATTLSQGTGTSGSASARTYSLSRRGVGSRRKRSWGWTCTRRSRPSAAPGARDGWGRRPPLAGGGRGGGVKASRWLSDCPPCPPWCRCAIAGGGRGAAGRVGWRGNDGRAGAGPPWTRLVARRLGAAARRRRPPLPPGDSARGCRSAAAAAARACVRCKPCGPAGPAICALRAPHSSARVRA